MALTIAQALAVSFNAVLNEKRGAANQWSESSFLKALEAGGFIKHESMGYNLEWTLDYQRNPSMGFAATDVSPVSLTKTEVLTAATSDIAEISGAIVWTKKDEVKNPSRSQKVALVKTLISNAIDSHDDLLEQALFATSTNGFYGLPTHIPTSGQGTDEGIDAATNTFWRNASNTYVDDTDIEAGMTTTMTQCAKGSGSSLRPRLIVSDAATWALFNGTQQALQRWNDSNKVNAGITSQKFMDADYVYSQYGTTSLFFLNPSCFQLIVSREYFRDLGDTQELPNQQGFRKLVYSALQTGTNNKSRLGVLHV